MTDALIVVMTIQAQLISTACWPLAQKCTLHVEQHSDTFQFQDVRRSALTELLPAPDLGTTHSLCGAGAAAHS